MSKRLAMTTDGRMTYCSASDANIGKGRCNHIIHQNKNENSNDFIKRVEELKENLDHKLNSGNKFDRIHAARNKYGLDKLINDEDVYVRVTVAQQGYGLDKLVNDEYSSIREAVAEQGYGLDKLVKDKDKYVRSVAILQKN